MITPEAWTPVIINNRSTNRMYLQRYLRFTSSVSICVSNAIKLNWPETKPKPIALIKEGVKNGFASQ